LLFYGAKGDIMAPATIFLSPVIVSVPFLALSMMGNTIIRAGTSHLCNGVYDYSSVNIALDFVFIKLLDLGHVANGILYFTSFLLFFGTLYIKLS
jgi:Na+-driven multidrug efflux pump